MTAVVVLGVLQGLLLAVVGAVVTLTANEPELQDALEADVDTVRVMGGALFTIGTIGFVFASMLATGSEIARSAFGALNVVHVAISVYALVALRDIAVGSLWPLLWASLVLWCLYGSDRAAVYFDR